MTVDRSNTLALLAKLTNLGFQLQVLGDRLRYWPRSAMTPELAEQVKSHKAELIAELTKSEGESYAAGECRRFLAVAQPTPDGTAWRDPEAMKNPVTRAVVMAGRLDDTGIRPC